jgi:hypothetical protein
MERYGDKTELQLQRELLFRTAYLAAQIGIGYGVILLGLIFAVGYLLWKVNP